MVVQIKADNEQKRDSADVIRQAKEPSPKKPKADTVEATIRHSAINTIQITDCFF